MRTALRLPAAYCLLPILLTACAPKEVPIPVLYSPALPPLPAECKTPPPPWPDIPERKMTPAEAAQAVRVRKRLYVQVSGDYAICQTYSQGIQTR